jgi:hypothetical protein
MTLCPVDINSGLSQDPRYTIQNPSVLQTTEFDL